MFLTDGNHGIQALLRHQHSVEADECVFKGLPKVLLGLVLWLFLELGLEVLLAELCALETTMPIENRKEADSISKVWVGDVCIFLLEKLIRLKGTYHIESPTLHC